MRHNKTFLIVILLLFTIIFGAAIIPQQPTLPPQGGTGNPAQGPQEPFTGYKNLKVLPKKISKEELEATMRGFRTALGVRCNFCHAPMADNPQRIDYANDTKPEKATARHMIKMTMAINKKYFNNKDAKTGAITAITCKSCHNGKQKPDLTI